MRETRSKNSEVVPRSLKEVDVRTAFARATTDVLSRISTGEIHDVKKRALTRRKAVKFANRSGATHHLVSTKQSTSSRGCSLSTH